MRITSRVFWIHVFVILNILNLTVPMVSSPTIHSLLLPSPCWKAANIGMLYPLFACKRFVFIYTLFQDVICGPNVPVDTWFLVVSVSGLVRRLINPSNVYHHSGLMTLCEVSNGKSLNWTIVLVETGTEEEPPRIRAKFVFYIVEFFHR